MDSCYPSATRETMTEVGGGPCVAQHGKQAGRNAASANPRSARLQVSRAAAAHAGLHRGALCPASAGPDKEGQWRCPTLVRLRLRTWPCDLGRKPREYARAATRVAKTGERCNEGPTDGLPTTEGEKPGFQCARASVRGVLRSAVAIPGGDPLPPPKEPCSPAGGRAFTQAGAQAGPLPSEQLPRALARGSGRGAALRNRESSSGQWVCNNRWSALKYPWGP